MTKSCACPSKYINFFQNFKGLPKSRIHNRYTEPNITNTQMGVFHKKWQRPFANASNAALVHLNDSKIKHLMNKSMQIVLKHGAVCTIKASLGFIQNLCF